MGRQYECRGDEAGLQYPQNDARPHDAELLIPEDRAAEHRKTTPPLWEIQKISQQFASDTKTCGSTPKSSICYRKDFQGYPKRR